MLECHSTQDSTWSDCPSPHLLPCLSYFIPAISQTHWECTSLHDFALLFSPPETLIPWICTWHSFSPFRCLSKYHLIREGFPDHAHADIVLPCPLLLWTMSFRKNHVCHSGLKLLRVNVSYWCLSSAVSREQTTRSRWFDHRRMQPELSSNCLEQTSLETRLDPQWSLYVCYSSITYSDWSTFSYAINPFPFPLLYLCIGKYMFINKIS